MTNPSYHKKCKATNEKKNWKGKLMGTCTQLQAQVKKKKKKEKEMERHKIRTGHGSLSAFRRHH